MTRPGSSNEAIATLLERVAALLETQNANPFRVRACRDAASSVREVKAALADRVRAGDGEALQEIPGVGESIVLYSNTARAHELDRTHDKVMGPFKPSITRRSLRDETNPHFYPDADVARVVRALAPGGF